MAVSGLNHVNIRTTDLAATVRFYTEILGFGYRGREMVNGFPRNWLLDGHGAPIIHLRELAADGTSFGAIDHVAFDCEALPDVVAKLEDAGIAFASIDTLEAGLTQIFLKDPNGVPLELNFRD